MPTGYRLALGVLAVTVVCAIVLLVIEAFGSTRDATKHGEVSVPGRASVNLPAGDVLIYYGDQPARDTPLIVPPNIRLRVRTTNGQALLGSTPFAGDQFADGDYERRPIANLRVPEAGDYEAVSASPEPGAVNPVLSFGENGTRDYSYVIFVLFGGALLAAILAVVTAIVARTSTNGRHEHRGRI
jgi:hypothetical protein